MENGKAPAVMAEGGHQALSLFKVADLLFKSGMFPQTRNACGLFSIVEYGRELGIEPMIALQTMAVVQGKISMSSQMMLSIAVKNGLEYKILETTDLKARVWMKGDVEYTSEFTLEDAKKAGIYKQDSSWTKYPKNMLFWRAVSNGIRFCKPGVLGGLYSTEEMVDAAATPLNAHVPEEPPAQVEEPDAPEFDWERWRGAMGTAFKTLDASVYSEILMQYDHKTIETVKEPVEALAILEDMRAAYKTKAA
jgi:hypothetical protein